MPIWADSSRNLGGYFTPETNSALLGCERMGNEQHLGTAGCWGFARGKTASLLLSISLRSMRLTRRALRLRLARSRPARGPVWARRVA
jgi:hypothetical protein